MRILFTSLRIPSHFQPLVPLVEACRRLGHEVAVAAPVELAERVAATGAAFFALAHPGDQALRPIWARLPSVAKGEAARIVVSEIFAGVCAGTALPTLMAAATQWRPAIVVRESQEYAAVVVCQKLGIRHVRMAITLGSAEESMFAAAASALDVHGQTLGLPPDPTGERIRNEVSFTQFPQSLDARPVASAGVVRRFRAERRPGAPLPAWWGNSQDPLLYLTFGTVAGNMDACRAAYRLALDAVTGLPLRVLLTTGADLPHESLGEIPANVHVERFVAQDDVFPHAALVVCHGGSGSVLGTLSAGLPQVVMPMFADQPANAERVAAVGAGLALPGPGVTAVDLRRAISQVSGDGSFRTAAQKVATEMAALPSVDNAVAALLELAGA